MATFLKSTLKVLLLGIGLLVLSWGIAIVWSDHGEWWLQLQTNRTVDTFYYLVRPMLSSDVTVAEEELQFWMFWVPSFFSLAAIAGVVLLAGNANKKEC